MKKSLWVILGFMSLPLQAADSIPSLTEVLSRLEQMENATTAVQFHYQQNIDFTSAASSSTVHGTALFKKDKKFIIKQVMPRDQKIVSNGKKAWIYTPEYKQVWVGSVDDWTHSSILPKGLIPVGGYVQDLKDNFNLSVVGRTSDQLVEISARPKNEQEGYLLTLFVSLEEGFPMKTVYKSASAVVKTSLTSIDTSPSYDEKDFTFTPPKNTDLISF